MARFYFAPNGLIVANNASHDAPFSIEQNDGAIMLFAAKENCKNEIYVPSYAVIDVKIPCGFMARRNLSTGKTARTT